MAKKKKVLTMIDMIEFVAKEEAKEKKKKKKISFILDDDLCAYFEFHNLYDEVINIAIKEFLDRSRIDWRSYNKQGSVKSGSQERKNK